ncbi:MAG: MerR family transcriptional regulator [Acidimicrobiales bacterium]|nr:MerR family transcriptional regulator [Acidimicrobiales bacterium]
MKVSELSAQSGVSVATIKFYLREGLLHAGLQTAANQADYDGGHVRRLRLIRALIDIGELPIAAVRAALTAVDDESTSLHDAFGAVMHGLDTVPPDDPAPDIAAARREVDAWLQRRRWKIEPDAPAPHALASAVAILRQFDFPVALAHFDEAAASAERSAEFEVGYARGMADRAAAVETMLIGTVVFERALAEIRRLALEAVSARIERQQGSGRRRRV